MVAPPLGEDGRGPTLKNYVKQNYWCNSLFLGIAIEEPLGEGQ